MVEVAPFFNRTNIVVTVGVMVFNAPVTRVGNFIIGASGSNKQMLSSGARGAALNIAAEKSKQKR